MPDTIYACDELAELHQHNALLKLQNRELLSRCDLLAAEVARYQEEVEALIEQMGD